MEVDGTYHPPMPYQGADEDAVSPQRDEPRRPYRAPELTIYGRMTDLTETGNGNGKESSMSNFRPVTLSNP
jgi:hypothetical protein